MPIADLCTRQVATVRREQTVIEVARMMRERHIGDVVICDSDGDSLKPVGILTDRDIVVGLLAMSIPAEHVKAADLMTPTLVTVNADMGFSEAIQMMERYGVRRLPVVDAKGHLIGIVSAMDLMQLLSTELMSLARISERQREKETEIRI